MKEIGSEVQLYPGGTVFIIVAISRGYAEIKRKDTGEMYPLTPLLLLEEVKKINVEGVLFEEHKCKTNTCDGCDLSTGAPTGSWCAAVGLSCGDMPDCKGKIFTLAPISKAAIEVASAKSVEELRSFYIRSLILAKSEEA